MHLNSEIPTESFSLAIMKVLLWRQYLRIYDTFSLVGKMSVGLCKQSPLKQYIKPS